MSTFQIYFILSIMIGILLKTKRIKLEIKNTVTGEIKEAESWIKIIFCIGWPVIFLFKLLERNKIKESNKSN